MVLTRLSRVLLHVEKWQGALLPHVRSRCSRQRRRLRSLPFRHGQVLLRGLFTVPGQPDGNVSSDVTGRGHGRGSGISSF